MQVCRLIYYSLSALHVSGDVFAHHQEDLTVFTASGNVHQCRCTVGVMDGLELTNKMQLCRLIYYSLSALHVSGGFRPSSGGLDCIYIIW